MDIQQWISDFNDNLEPASGSVSLPNDIMMLICSYQNDQENLNIMSKLSKEK